MAEAQQEQQEPTGGGGGGGAASNGTMTVHFMFLLAYDLDSERGAGCRLGAARGRRRLDYTCLTYLHVVASLTTQ